jgi:LysR family nod box-dependent transcriptional activator
MTPVPPRSFRQLDLNLLVALDALLTEVSVTRAGDRIGLSQSAMSGSLARLRGFFGDQLLARAGREYRLTPTAHELVGPVREILSRIDATLSSREERQMAYRHRSQQRRHRSQRASDTAGALDEP